MKSVKINKEEFFLLEHAYKHKSYGLKFPEYKVSGDFIRLYSDKRTFIFLRESCARFLQMVGFDKNDTPTERGLVLESLIDKLDLDN